MIRSGLEFSIAAAVQLAAQANDFEFPLSKREKQIQQEALDAIRGGAPVADIFKRIETIEPAPDEAKRGTFDPLRIIDFLKEKIRGGGS